ncbi:transcription factor RelB isoform X2 [Scleropages formosus]|nr:transcription factor RelB isoform X2 [Scleropages formosus]
MASPMSSQGGSSRSGRSRGVVAGRSGPILRQHREIEPLEMFLDAPKCVIVEQPKERGMRFRYECEGRSAGSILGASSTEANKTLPTVEIQGNLKHIKKVKITVSLVTKDIPHRPHPHSLVGKDCADGICVIFLNPRTHQRHSFTNLGIQCVRRKELDSALEKRRKQKIDPFNTDHSKSIEDIDMNVVRLCFQCQLEREDGEKIFLNPVVSNPIFDKKATTTSELKINRLNLDHGPCTGKTEIYLLCDKVQKDDIEIIFSRGSWEAKAEFAQTDVHRQIAIVFKSPPYQEQDITEKVEVNVFLRRISDHMDSEPVKFTYVPHNPDPYEVNRKRKIKTDLQFKERCSVTAVQHPVEGPTSHQFDPFSYAPPEPAYSMPDPLQEGLLSRPSQPLEEIHYSNSVDFKQEDNIFSSFEINSEDLQLLCRTLTQSIDDSAFSTLSMTACLDPQVPQDYTFSQTDLDHTTNLSLTNMDQNFNISLDNRLDLEFYNDVQFNQHFNQLSNGNHVPPLEALPQDPTGPTSQGLSLVKTESHVDP